ncbi:MAG: galactokinase family protein [Oscillospiraceae bacterium]|nr:galactokinase [Oscillospiraceae bacterium]MDY3064444.1 galactokinase family protein [Oscillospiraceae bacterium]
MISITTQALQAAILAGSFDSRLLRIYHQDQLESQRARYAGLAGTFAAQFHENRAPMFFSAPGRTELAGNHTDHQHGRVLAGAVTLDAVAAALPCKEHAITLHSAGYSPVCISIDDLKIHPEEKNTTAALLRGMAAGFQNRGAAIGGAVISVASDVLSGSGLSSSACFEVLIGCIFNELFFGGACTAEEIAQIGQYAENVYFGKPSGLMDQTACAVGGCVAIDFKNPEYPVIEPVGFSPAQSGYALVIIDSGADHADLTEDYASIPQEMKKAAAVFGKTVLRDVDPALLFTNSKKIRQASGDRAFLRAVHFFNENERVLSMTNALRQRDIPAFLAGVRASGASSWELLQNIYSDRTPQKQALAVALTAAEHALSGEGAVRVHGGGFAGTIQAYVPFSLLPAFISFMEQTLFTGCCHVLDIRQEGCLRVI